MGARGKKSASELATVAMVGPGGVMRTRRPEPPAHLCEEAARLWRAICNASPADALHAGALPILGAYCALSVSLRRTLGVLERLETAGDFDPVEWRDTQRQAASLAGRLAMLAGKLRLTPSALIRPEVAGRRARDTRPLSVYDQMLLNGEA